MAAADERDRLAPQVEEARWKARQLERELADAQVGGSARLWRPVPGGLPTRANVSKPVSGKQAPHVFAVSMARMTWSKRNNSYTLAQGQAELED